MAHSCPKCGMTCHCGGDIDDICFDENDEVAGCTCCDGEDEPEGFDDDYLMDGEESDHA